MEEILKQLTAVYNSLNMIEVKGRPNLDRLMGSIMALEHLMTEIRSLEQPEKEE